MTIPFVQPAIKAVKNWAASPVSPISFTEPGKLAASKSFDETYPLVSDPIRLNDYQLQNLRHEVSTYVSSFGESELALAVSRIPDSTDPARVSALARDIIRHFREENLSDPDGAAALKMLASSTPLKHVTEKLEAARLAERQALSEQQEIEAKHREFRSLPNRFEQLTGRIAGLKAQRNELAETNFKAKIEEILRLEYFPRPGVQIAASIPALLLVKETLPLRLKVIDEVVASIEAEVAKLREDNQRLAAELDLKEHKLL